MGLDQIQFDCPLDSRPASLDVEFAVDIFDVGAMVTFLASDYAKNITGDTIYIDGGYHIVG